MKFAKLFMAIAVICLAVACANPEKQVEKATKAAENKEWVDAAKALSKISPADMAEEAQKESKIYEEASIVLFAIAMSEDEEAMKILEEWGEKVEKEIEKLEKK